jgi:metaxin
MAHRSDTERLISKAYLNFSGVAYKTVPSSNHASPSGMLPFLQPAVTAKDTSNAPDAITSNKLRKWAQAQSSTSIEESEDMRYEAYVSLVSNALRKAWVSPDDQSV